METQRVWGFAILGLSRKLHLCRKLLSGREFRKVEWGRLVPVDVSPVHAKTSVGTTDVQISLGSGLTTQMHFPVTPQVILCRHIRGLRGFRDRLGVKQEVIPGPFPNSESPQYGIVELEPMGIYRSGSIRRRWGGCSPPTRLAVDRWVAPKRDWLLLRESAPFPGRSVPDQWVPSAIPRQTFSQFRHAALHSFMISS